MLRQFSLADVLKRFKSDSDEASLPLPADKRAATVEDETDAQPERFQGEREVQDEQDDDDEDGRFFGGGLNEEQTVRLLKAADAYATAYP